jgi:acetyl-CoA carboxylase biotin carboxyl carrier protein
MKDTLEATAGENRDGVRELLAPTVCRLTAAPAIGTLLKPGMRFGEVRVLRRVFELVVPRGVRGVVSEVIAVPPVGLEFGQPLVVVSREAAIVGGADAEADAAEDGVEIPDGMVAIRAQTDGIFYRRPSPEDPAFVSEGDEIDLGKVLGLVEVMKCFNQVKAPEAGRVTRILVDDADEVNAMQPLVLIEPR